MTSAFENIFRASTMLPGRDTGALAEGLLEVFPDGLVQVPGHCSEIVRDSFGVTHRAQANAETMADLVGMHGSPFVIDHFDLWIDQVRPVIACTGHREWDLFFMEQEYGVRVAQVQSQWDLVHEAFTPFNHRGVLTALMGVDPAHRQPPHYAANRRVVEILWPAATREPFNEAQKSLSARSVEICLKMRDDGVRETISKGVRKLQAQVVQRSNG